MTREQIAQAVAPIIAGLDLRNVERARAAADEAAGAILALHQRPETPYSAAFPGERPAQSDAEIHARSQSVTADQRREQLAKEIEAAWDKTQAPYRRALVAADTALSALERQAMPPLWIVKEDGSVERVPEEVPGGWRLVPKDATPEMVAACQWIGRPLSPREMWRQMIAVAPQVAEQREVK